MSYTSLADFLEELERLGQLRSVDAEVDAPGEVAVDDTAVLFRNIRGSDAPLVVGLLGTEARICHALAVASLDELGRRLQQAIATRTAGEAPGNRAASTAERVLAKFAPRPSSTGACQKIVRFGEDVDLEQLPVPRGSPEQTHRVITAGQLVSRDPASGRLLIGHAELSVRSRRELAVHWVPDDPLGQLLEAYRDRGRPMPLAVALGGPPGCLLAAMAPLPAPLDGSALAGFLAGGSLETVRCRTVDLNVPAEAEMVLEGAIDPSAAEVETGPTATPLGHAAPSRPAPVMRVTAWTHRANPVFPAIVHGPASREWVSITRAMQKILLPLLRIVIAELVDCNLPECGHGRQLAWVSIRRPDDQAARRVARTLWELPATRFCKLMVIVDEAVDVHDANRLWQAVATRMDPRRDVFFDEGPADAWDPAGAGGRPLRRMALDATNKNS